MNDTLNQKRNQISEWYIEPVTKKNQIGEWYTKTVDPRVNPVGERYTESVTHKEPNRWVVYTEPVDWIGEWNTESKAQIGERYIKPVIQICE